MISFLGKGSNESDDFSESNDEFSGELVSTLVPSPVEKAIFVREGMVSVLWSHPRCSPGKSLTTKIGSSYRWKDGTSERMPDGHLMCHVVSPTQLFTDEYEKRREES